MDANVRWTSKDSRDAIEEASNLEEDDDGLELLQHIEDTGEEVGPMLPFPTSFAKRVDRMESGAIVDDIIASHKKGHKGKEDR